MGIGMKKAMGETFKRRFRKAQNPWKLAPWHLAARLAHFLNSILADIRVRCLQILDPEADYLHLDVMGRHFVPSITFGPLWEKASKSSKARTLSLMCTFWY